METETQSLIFGGTSGRPDPSGAFERLTNRNLSISFLGWLGLAPSSPFLSVPPQDASSLVPPRVTGSRETEYTKGSIQRHVHHGLFLAIFRSRCWNWRSLNAQ